MKTVEVNPALYQRIRNVGLDTQGINRPLSFNDLKDNLKFKVDLVFDFSA